jgi:putative FmdB family regulatory protein
MAVEYSNAGARNPGDNPGDEQELAVPIYQYAADSGECDRCEGRFEHMQKMAEPPLAACPRCARPVHREICAVRIGRSNPLTSKNIEQQGFTQYKKSGKGVYEKTAGKGPDTIVR